MLCRTLLGILLLTPLLAAADIPVIGSVSPDITLSSGSTTANIWAEDITTEDGIQRVDAEIVDPAGAVFSVRLFENTISGRYEGNYSDFVKQGVYVANFTVTDLTGDISASVASIITQPVNTNFEGPDFYEDDDTPDDAKLLVIDDINAQKRSFHDVGDVDYVRFFVLGADGSKLFTIQLDYLGDTSLAPSLLADPVIQLLASDGTTLIEKIDSGLAGQGEFFDFTPTASDLYFLRISNLNNVTGKETAYSLKIFESIAAIAGPDLVVNQSFFLTQLPELTPMLIDVDLQNLGGQGDDQTVPSIELRASIRNFEVFDTLPTTCTASDNLISCDLGNLDRDASLELLLPLRPTAAGRQRIVMKATGIAGDGRKMPDPNFNNNLSELILDVQLATDTDGDGLPDNYEDQFEGLDPNNPNDGALDPDLDGQTTLAEFQSGTNPFDSGENKPPTIQLTGSPELTLRLGQPYVEKGATGQDPEDGILNATISGSVDINTIGSYTLTYVVTDAGNLTASTTRTVVVTSDAIRLSPDKILPLPVVGKTFSTPSGGTVTIPDNATAVSLNVTVVNPETAGFVTVWPCSADRPVASNLNYVQNQVIPNGVIASIGNEGNVCFYSSRTTDIIADISGYFVGNTYTADTPKRLIDSRGFETINGFVALDVSPTAPVRMAIANTAVPNSAGGNIVIPADVVAAAFNVTVVEPAANGFATVYPCETGVELQSLPLASNVNYLTGQIIPNGAISQVSSDGSVCVFASQSTDVVIDLAGWFTGDAFKAATPLRLVDTRDGTGAPGGRMSTGSEISVPVIGRALSVAGQTQALPDTATAVSLNVTAVTPGAAGFLTVYPCGIERPNASNLNYLAGDVIANNVIAPIGSDGSVCVFTQSETDVVVDISGWFEGSADNGFNAVAPSRLIDTRTGIGPAPTND